MKMENSVGSVYHSLDAQYEQTVMVVVDVSETNSDPSHNEKKPILLWSAHSRQVILQRDPPRYHLLQ